MGTLRPAVKADDPYIKKIINYIPIEVVAAYTAIMGYLSLDANTDIPPEYKWYYIIAFIALGLITPIWMFYTVYDKADTQDKKYNAARARFQAVIAFFAFIIWAYALNNPLLKAIICECDNTGCPECAFYSIKLGAIILVLFTLTVPLLDRIIMGTALPPSRTIQKAEKEEPKS